jgi:hemoglobin-like flavoprotein
VVQWVVVLGVGILVVAVVLGLNLIPRLSAGQKVLSEARPAFRPASRVTADRAGINIISQDVNMADPLMERSGGGAGEVGGAVAFVAAREHLSDAGALALLQKDFPHTTALLQAIPLSAVTAELPRLEALLEKLLRLSPAQLAVALKADFPALAQAIAYLPMVTHHWDSIAGIGGLTRFDGTPVLTVPQLRDYFSDDVIPVLERQRTHFDSLDGTSSVSWIAPLLLIVGIVVVLFAAMMILRSWRGQVRRQEALAGAGVVTVVGVVVVALVLILNLVPRTSNGQKLLDALRPAWTAQRVAGDRAGIEMVSAIVNLETPIMNAPGGAAGEVPKLIALVSAKTGLAPSAVLATLHKDVPHTTALLQALPLTGVAAELPALTTLITPAIPKIPRLAQTVIAASSVIREWDAVPGTDGARRFDGTPITTVPQVRDYFSDDVIPVLERERTNYDKLVKTSKIDFIGPLVLIVGIIVVIYGLLMLRLARRRPAAAPAASDPPPNEEGPLGQGDVQLIKQSWAQVEPIADTAATLFYGRLFELAPELRPMFTGDMHEQGRKLMQMLAMVVRGLDRLERIVPAVQQLGERHAGYGVRPEHYEVVGAALLWTLEQGLGEAFTPPVRSAWTTAYRVLASTMQDAALAAAA